MSVSHAFSDGVLQDYVYVHMWENVAASYANKISSKLRYIVTKYMAPVDVYKHRLASEFVRKKHKGCCMIKQN